ncbi:MAG TPA: sulfate adenylyltransferase subunit CysN [Microvirga sp.]|nr:sulfate adenylyltransferase subunit CysN [Microvirga sp.]
MTVHPSPEGFVLDDYLAAHERKSLLRFITCGSVDDGKSTLIGRLLYESKRLFDDQLATLERDSRKHGTTGGAIDFALLVDGLASEREQGITIDVAYRFFSTERRTFIVADTPGHEQYTRNMATGASTADLAVLLVDARKGLTRQTRRHSLLVSMLGIRQVVLAVNKMDLIDWSEASFHRIAAEFAAFSADLGFDQVVAIPLSALGGDNVVVASSHTPWYRGPALLSHLETVEVEKTAKVEPFRMPVQWVNRPNPDFRGFAGLVTSGEIAPGARVRVLPSGAETTIARIVTLDGDLDAAVAGQSVTVTLADELDISRGDILASVDHPPDITDRVEVRLFWMAGKHLHEGDQFLLKLGTQTVVARVSAIRRRIDLADFAPVAASALDVNDIGDVALALDRPVALDVYAENRRTGGFILIDRENFDTVAMGLVSARGSGERARAAEARRSWLKAPEERAWRSMLKAFSWRATGSLDTMLVAFFFTHDARLSAAIGATEVLTKLVLYYGHERIWTRIGFGLATRSGRAR